MQQQQIHYLIRVPPGHEIRPIRSPLKGFAIVSAAIVIAGILVSSAIYFSPPPANETSAAGLSNADNVVQYMLPGNYLDYSLTRGSSSSSEGSVRITFLSFDLTSCQASVTSDVAGFVESNTSYKYSMEGGVFTSEALTGVMLDPANLVGEERIMTIYGERSVDHYRYAINGLTAEHYVLHGTGIPMRSVTSYGSETVTLELQETNIGWLRSA